MVCSREAEDQVLQQIGSYREKWRFKGRNPASRPRQKALGTFDPFSDIGSVKPVDVAPEDPFELDTEFPDVPHELLKKDTWSLRFSQRMIFKEHITLLEGRGIVATRQCQIGPGSP